MARLSIALVHWPVLDKKNKEIATSVTHFDVHDIARVARSYGLENYFIVNRLKEQLMYVERILDHWRVKGGSTVNEKRTQALSIVKTAETLQDVIKSFKKRPYIVATAAKAKDDVALLSFKDAREKISNNSDLEILLVFGTGNGLSPALKGEVDAFIEPVHCSASDGYNHLSVRSAVSIILDRLLGVW